MSHKALITLQEGPTLAALFRQRVARTPDAIAYIQYDDKDEQWHDYSWAETAREVTRWQKALGTLNLETGERIVIMCHNSREWVVCDQATLGLGLVLVPVFMNDRAESITWICNDCSASVLIIEGQEQWDTLEGSTDELESVQTIISIHQLNTRHPKLKSLQEWLPADIDKPDLAESETSPTELATIVYTSGTTGRPKGVMLSHHNIVWNIHAALQLFDIGPDNTFLSFLPLSHTFERTVGYYLSMVCGATTAYNRSIPQLAEDLAIIKPTLLVSVPRIFERIYGRVTEKLVTESTIKQKLFSAAIDIGWKKFEYDQGRGKWSPGFILHPLLDKLVGAKVRERLGGRLWFTVCGGAALSPEVARMFIGLGIPVTQGYGLTETSPVIAANPLENNIPASVGLPLPGVEIQISDNGELLTRSPSIMLGYWNRPEATADMIDTEGWLHTGDKALIEDDHIFITGRLKEIIVLSTGEKIPPADMENTITLDPLIEQVMIIGEGKPYLSALVVPNPEQFEQLCQASGLEPGDESNYSNEVIQEQVLQRIRNQLSSFPGYAEIHKVAILNEPMTPENGLLTPTLKLRRNRILIYYSDEVTNLYAGH
ncbi:MAG TPA: long-chain fatty acid--CoA ligase [Thiolapillus brandeum]|uniref:Long-chain fatty acid--CoA ligase n=1 Tax=Thiolapillus brandeum TaxID=1076588 RepID=A0A831JYJ5_9GAMM|nr:long-chain fatty acid--CoA ligase [Thiolapillus brandeum]